MTQITGDGVSAVNAKTGVITLVARDAGPPVVPAVTVKGADLFDSGGAETKGGTFVADAIKEINSQLERLNAFIALDALGDEASADAGRTSVWEALADAIQLVVGEVNGADGEQIFAAADYVTTAADDSDADAAAKEIINDVLDALSSAAKFMAAVAEDGALYGDSGLVTGNAAALKAVFGRVKSTTTVDFGSTRYTRFGVWNRTTSANAEAGPVAAPTGANGVFAYSPLEATAYSLNDPNFPGGGEATYEGTTIARSNTAGDNINTYYEGSITIGVTWASNVDTAANVGNITAQIENLRTSKGAAYMVGTGDDANAVATILFTAEDINVARSETDNTLSFGVTGSAVRLRHTDIRVTDVTGSSNLNGMFVGKVIDGPLGIIGSWTLGSVTDGDDLVGAFGADLMP